MLRDWPMFYCNTEMGNTQYEKLKIFNAKVSFKWFLVHLMPMSPNKINRVLCHQSAAFPQVKIPSAPDLISGDLVAPDLASQSIVFCASII